MSTDSLRSFETKAAFDASRGDLPHPGVASFKEENDLFVCYRNANPLFGDKIYTVGASRFIIGCSALGGAAVLGSAKHAVQTTVPPLI